MLPVQQFIHSSIFLQQETQLLLTNCTTNLNKCNGVADLLKHTHSHMCYHAKFGHSTLKSVGLNSGEPQNCEALEFHSLAMFVCLFGV